MIDITKLRYYVQKVLPLVYDDSLSYYELLCKVVTKTNELVSATTDMSDSIDELTSDVKDIDNKVEGLISNLVDVIVPWNSEIAYRIYSIVEYQGSNYIAIQDVPVGIMITNTAYWTEANTIVDQINAIAVITSELKEYEPIGDKVVCPQMFGTIDGVDDNIEIQAALDSLKSTGGICIIPSGTYNLTQTIFVPENVSVIGYGRDTVLYLANSTAMGVCITNAGDNVRISNITVEFVNGETVPTTTGSQLGGIGISTVIYDNAMTDDLTTRRDTKNINLDHIYSDGNYAIQIEPDGNHVLSNVNVSDVIADEACVSVSPSGSNNTRNINLNNIVCSFFRIGYGSFGSDGINVNNLSCDILAINDNNVNVTNLDIDVKNSRWVQSELYNRAVTMRGSNNKITNANIRQGSSILNYGIYKSDSNTHATYTNVSVEGFTTDFYNQTGSADTIVSCKFGSNSQLYGTGFNVDYTPVDANLSTFKNFGEKKLNSASLASGVVPAVSTSNRIYRNGSIVNVNMCVAKNAGLDTSSIATIPTSMRPAETVSVIGIMYVYGSNNMAACVVNINTDGTVTISNVTNTTLSNFTRVGFTASYSI